MDLAMTLAGLGAFAGLSVLANWQSGRKWHGERPRIVPWRTVLVLSAFCLVVLLVHLLNLFGVETGPENRPSGRF